MVTIVNIYGKGFIRVLPVLCGLVWAVVSIFMGLVDFSTIADAAWVAVPNFTVAKFSASALTIIAPKLLLSLW